MIPPFDSVETHPSSLNPRSGYLALLGWKTRCWQTSQEADVQEDAFVVFRTSHNKTLTVGPVAHKNSLRSDEMFISYEAFLFLRLRKLNESWHVV